MQLFIRRRLVKNRMIKSRNRWPIDQMSANAPLDWPGWPKGKKFALVLTHDVEKAIGMQRVCKLAELERELGFKAIFNFVGGDYHVEKKTLQYLLSLGFEIGVHGFSHRLNLFRSIEVFEKHRDKINRILKEWGATGFRAPSMYHNMDWIGQLDIEYDMSTFDTDPFEPQPDGMGTIFPFWFQSNGQKGYLELPYTLPQDHTLFILLKETSIDIWKKKLNWIAEKGGMALLITHPDYMNLGKKKSKGTEYPIDYYLEFLQYVRQRYEGEYWNCLPKEMVCFWTERIVGNNILEVNSS